VPGTVVPIRGGPLKDVDRRIQNASSDVMGHRSRPYIEFKHVSISFRETPVLNDVSFSVLEGETVCILGRSGVGKSVSLRIIMGFLKPDSGRVITAQEDITNYSEEELQRVHRKVTMVFQNGAIRFFDSCRECGFSID